MNYGIDAMAYFKNKIQSLCEEDASQERLKRFISDATKFYILYLCHNLCDKIDDKNLKESKKLQEELKKLDPNLQEECGQKEISKLLFRVLIGQPMIAGDYSQPLPAIIKQLESMHTPVPEQLSLANLTDNTLG